MVEIPYRTDQMVGYGCVATTGGSKSALLSLIQLLDLNSSMSMDK
jgi:hypothetical protein